MTLFKQGCMHHSDTVEQGVEGVVILLGSFAYPILFICIFLSLAEPALHTPDLYNLVVMLVQAFGLDLGGSALVMRGLTMRKVAGHEEAGKRTVIIGGIIIGLTVLSLAFIVVPQIYPAATDFSKKADSVLMLVRVVGSAAYGFILHLVKGMDVEVQTLPPQPQLPTLQDTELEKKLITLMETVSELSKKIDAAPQVPAIDTEAIVATIVEQLQRANISANENDDESEQLANDLPDEYRINQRTTSEQISDDVANISAMVFADSSANDYRRITRKLSEHSANTDPLQFPQRANISADKKARQSGQKTSASEPVKRMLKILKKEPDIKVAELARRASVSVSYASEKRRELLESIQ